MLRPDDLVGVPDFPLGNLTVSPARRVVENGEKSLTLEPRVMQLLVLLARERGKVVTRQTLFDEIWGGVPVGDDSLNRAAAGVRRAIELDRDNLGLETIPRTGYRLNVGSDAAPAGGWSRRQLAIGGAAGVAVASGAGTWWISRSRDSRAFDAMMTKAEDSLKYDDRSGEAIPYLNKAIEVRPDDARAHGLLAFANAIRLTTPGVDAAAALKQAESSSAAALAIDSSQPDALLSQLLLQRPMLDFAATEDRLRELLAAAPRNVRIMRQMWDVLHCVGRSRDALAFVERALTVEPQSAKVMFPRAQLLWITGRVPEADRVIDRAMDYWPNHPWVRFARYTIFAFTGRARAALEMLDKGQLRPPVFLDEIVPVLRATLTALENPTPATIAVARQASLDASERRPQGVAQPTMAMAALGELDAAFKMADAMFVGSAGSQPAKGTSWRFTPFLFTPPMTPMWTDPRFDAIADAAGLTDYWTKRGIGPDFRGGKV